MLSCHILTTPRAFYHSHRSVPRVSESQPARLGLHTAVSQGGTWGDVLEIAREEVSLQRRQIIKVLVPSGVSVQTINRFLENRKHTICDVCLCVCVCVHTHTVGGLRLDR